VRISEKIHKSGYFWLPSKPKEKLPGTLSISESGEAELEILGVFGDPVVALSDESEVERINGLIEGGRFITLDKCFYKRKSISFGGISKSTFYVHFVFIGVLYQDRDELLYSSFTFSVEGLDEWLSITGINVEHDLEAQKTSIVFKPPKEISMNLTEDIDLLFIFGGTTPYFGNITEAKVTQKAYISLRSKESLPDNVQDIVH
jgi:hypothetical protein